MYCGALLETSIIRPGCNANGDSDCMMIDDHDDDECASHVIS